MVSNSSSKIHETWSKPFSRALYMAQNSCRYDANLMQVLLTPSHRLYGLNVSFGGLPNCAAPCRSPYLDEKGEQALETWMTILASLGALSAMLSFFVHIGNLER